jgi:hypothetical protein
VTSSTVFRLTRFSAIVTAVLIGIAMLFYPGGTVLNPSTRGYSVFHNSLSDLGSRVAWNGQANSRSALFHLAASLLLVVVGVACFAALIRVYSSSTMASRMGRTAAAVVLVAAAGLTGAVSSPPDRHPAIHGGFTLMAVCSFPVVTALLALVTALDGRFRGRASIGWLVLTLVVVMWAALMSWRPTTDLELAIPVTLQKVAAVTLLCTLALKSYEAEHVIARAGRRAVCHRFGLAAAKPTLRGRR